MTAEAGIWVSVAMQSGLIPDFVVEREQGTFHRLLGSSVCWGTWSTTARLFLVLSPIRIPFGKD